jgi:GNAT superfamily N-acetyltransferase
MANISIEPVATRRRKRQFLELPWFLYADDPHWVPPLRGNQKELVGYRPHPFYEDAVGQTFLALRDGRPCGRILALVNHAHDRRFNERRGFFGFFESIDDPGVASGLLDAASTWLRSQGATAMRGPCNPSLNYECGLLIEGFDSPPTFMMTYNPPYYAGLLENYGLAKSQDMFAYVGHVDMLDSLDEKLLFIAQEVQSRFDLLLRGAETSHFAQEVATFLDLYNRSMVGMWGFVPLSDAEVRHLASALRWLIVPEMVSVALAEGRPIGVSFGMLDYNPIIKEIDGRLFPFGFLKLFLRRRSIQRVRLISTNVLPEYQRWGVGLVLQANMLPKGLAWGMKEAEFSWVMESNHLSLKTLERGGAKRTKTFRLYDYEFRL